MLILDCFGMLLRIDHGKCILPQQFPKVYFWRETSINGSESGKIGKLNNWVQKSVQHTHTLSVCLSGPFAGVTAG